MQPQVIQNPSALAAVHALASGTSSTSSSSSNSASITSNDFLQLLVTEMKNQDPTAQNDPNQYISQLVQVNSLQQLIQINQDLGGASSTGSSSGSSASAATGKAVAAPGTSASGQNGRQTGLAAGNLSAPPPDNAASRLASALGVASPSSTGQLDSLLSALKGRAESVPASNLNPAR